MSRPKPEPSEYVTCPHCQTEIPITWDWLPPGAKVERIVVTCYACGDAVSVCYGPALAPKDGEAAQ
jgi:predicted Zn finger-like uncharacterized protein